MQSTHIYVGHESHSGCCLWFQEGTEVSQAKDMFGGRLTQDFVAEKLCVSDFNKLMELDFPNMNIRSIDLGHGDTFLNLRRWGTASLHLVLPVTYLHCCLAISIRSLMIYNMDVKHMKHTNIPLCFSMIYLYVSFLFLPLDVYVGPNPQMLQFQFLVRQSTADITCVKLIVI